MVRKPLHEALSAMERQGGFTFSYSGAVVNKDSMVSVSCAAKPLRQVLDDLLDGRYEYRERGRHLILRPAQQSNAWVVSGYVMNAQTGQGLAEASIYEPQQLASALTDDAGYFRMKLKRPSLPGPVVLQVRKAFYEEASMIISDRHTQPLRVTIAPRSYSLDETFVTLRHGKGDTTLPWHRRLFLSSRQRMRDLNLDSIIANKPYQVSLVPGLGSHGRLSAVVANTFSLNVLGGYNAAVHGAEVGGLFNIVRGDVDGVQVGGLFNIAGGAVDGAQVAGLFNTADSAVDGVQVSGLVGYARGHTRGVQVSGIYSHSRGVRGTQVAGIAAYTHDSLRGAQISGIVSYAQRSVSGIQVSGIAGIAPAGVHGTQVSGIFNYTQRLHGLQIGLINVADTSDGYSVGLLNLVRKGYHKIALYSNEVISVNAALKTGNAKLYTILLAGINPDDGRHAFSFGYGLGTDRPLSRHWTLSPELTAQHLYRGDWDHLNLLSRATLSINWQPAPWLRLSGGPAYSVLYSNQRGAQEGYLTEPSSGGLGLQRYNNRTSGWVGWQVGLAVF